MGVCVCMLYIYTRRITHYCVFKNVNMLTVSYTMHVNIKNITKRFSSNPEAFASPLENLHKALKILKIKTIHQNLPSVM